MQDPHKHYDLDWTSQRNNPRPDFLSSSRKRLAPQLMYKGGIINGWAKKQAVAVDRTFFATLPIMPEVPRDKADIVWLVYDVMHDTTDNIYHLRLVQSVYTAFEAALIRITVAEPPPLESFMQQLQTRLNTARVGSLPTSGSTLTEVLDPAEPDIDPDVV